MRNKYKNPKMLLSSIGHHTINMFHKLTVEEGNAILDNAFKLQKSTKEIRVRPLNMGGDISDSDNFTQNLKCNSSYFQIEYTTKYKGLSWLLRLSLRSPGFITFNSGEEDDHPCSIKAKINPKVFSGIKDYLSASSSENLEEMEKRFNQEASKISPLLGNFSDYEFNRVDFCVNFSLHELGIDCDPLIIMDLFQRSNLPHHFGRPWKQYTGNLLTFDEDAISIASLPADESDRNSFVLKSDSININCYYKYNELKNNFADCPNIRDSTDVIRFEVQCLYAKTYYLSKQLRNKEGFTNLFSEMLSDDTSSSIINNYFDKIIGRGDYYSMDEAIKMIQSYKFAAKKENRLIDVLKKVEMRGGISYAKLMIVNPEVREDFRRSLRELANIRINPVTIPKEHGISHIRNLLDAYYDKLAEERNEKREADMRTEILDDILNKKSNKLLRRQMFG